MKKILLMSAVSLLVLAGCKDASVKVSEESKVMLKVGNKEITKGQLATAMNSYKYESTVEIVKNALYDELVPINDEVNTKLNTELEALKKRVTTSTVSWEDSLKNSGTTEEEYKNKVLMPSIRANLLAKKYVEATFDERLEQYKPIKLAVFETASEDKAKKAVEEISAGKSFTEAYSAHGDTSYIGLNGNTITTFSGEGILDEMVYQQALQSKVGEVKYVANTTGQAFFVFKVENADPNSFKAEAIEKILTSASIIKDSFAYYLNERKIEIYDIDVYKGFERDYKVSIKNAK